VGPDAAIWLHEQGMGLLARQRHVRDGSLPFPDPTRTTHRAMLVERGIHLVEILDLEKVTKAGIRSP
jgi:hypothetical protein